jgi:hypothetical protein
VVLMCGLELIVMQKLRLLSLTDTIGVSRYPRKNSPRVPHIMK